MGSWIHKGEELDFKIVKDGVVNKTLEPNGEWELDSYTAKNIVGISCCPNVTYPTIKINLKINRLHGAHTASIVIPTVGKC